MADRPDTIAATARPHQKSPHSAKPDATTQFRTRGYVIDESADLALKDIANGLDALAQLCEDRIDDVPEIPPAHWAGLLRTFSRQTQQIYDQAAFANDALARRRD